MDIITVTKDNLEKEHICCAIGNNNDCGVSAKKLWLSKEFDEGLVFKKGNVRGKCFIEYIPSEMAWCPIEAPSYMFINCLWVSGKFKGKGNSSILLNECIKDSKEKGKKGLVILSSKKKMPYISDGKFLRYKGFQLADKLNPYYELLYLPFSDNSNKPFFKDSVRNINIKEKGFVLFYSHQCPFTAKYVPLIKSLAQKKNIPFKTVLFESKEEAQNAPSPFTTYSLFYNGEFVTNDILSEKKFEKLLIEKEL
ncbi:YoaP domain-containing protein [Clostridium fallax]|uniref:YoaP-like n=1 Tax=Clostridium fallax TaxID=1533 RepID=A0A1M4XUF5_9CLOT|nr:YoaP domain-containing protein [Clostridium fallax]SHE96903.1 YoaP-like [Clostridium fallax]SQB06540.1 N-acetyltransferase YoaP [Clostridium fallax]